jgi:hypothetical protein
LVFTSRVTVSMRTPAAAVVAASRAMAAKSSLFMVFPLSSWF